MAFAESTKSTYRSYRRSYISFCLQMGYRIAPASPTQLCRYAAYLAGHLKPQSIPKYLNIVKLIHKETGCADPMDGNWWLQTLLLGIKRDKGVQVRRKLPITPELLLGIRSRLDMEQMENVVFWAACLLAFYGLLRKANLFPPAIASFDPSKHLRRRDFIQHAWGIEVIIRSTKTIQFNQRQLSLPLPYLGQSHPLCPVTAIYRAFAATVAAKADGPAFMIPRPQGLVPLLYCQFMVKLRGCLGKLGINQKDYAGHSFRRGGATWALSSNMPGEVIKLLGDWKSDAYMCYIEVPLLSRVEHARHFAKGLPTHLH